MACAMSDSAIPALAHAPRVLCDDVTHQAAKRAFEFAELAPIAVKGKAERVSVFQPVTRRDSRGEVEHPKQALGRDSELEVARALTERVRARAGGGTVFVIGEPGMGKSVLVSETLARAQAGGGV